MDVGVDTAIKFSKRRNCIRNRLRKLARSGTRQISSKKTTKVAMPVSVEVYNSLSIFVPRFMPSTVKVSTDRST